MKQVFHRFARDESGTATVEFVLWLPMVMLAFGLTVDVSMIFHSQSQVLRIVQDANRNASIGRLRTPAETEDYVEARLQAASSGAHATSSISAGVISTTVTYPARDFQIVGFFSQFNDLQITVNSEHLLEDWGA
ncbi:MAG: pilus assembly protein [Maritimibacter sp.]|nr:pilus assembly protein [Maritimibacter sp.]